MAVHIADDYSRSTLGFIELLQLETVTYDTYVVFVGMKKEVDGPVLCFVAVVAERASELELECPSTGDQQVRCPFGSGRFRVSGQRIQIFRY